jgi:hypothetical protein
MKGFRNLVSTVATVIALAAVFFGVTTASMHKRGPQRAINRSVQ